jgi:hypothetical protein
MVSKLLIFVFILCCAFSCKKPPNTPQPVEEKKYIRMDVFPKWNNETLHLDSIYTTDEGYLIKFTNLNFYISDLSNNTNTLSTALFIYRNSNILLTTEDDFTKFNALQGNLGVGTENHLDPSAFPIESPLNIMNANGMHWGWNPGYTFIQVEAMVDTIVDGNTLLDHSIVYHVGKDENLQSFQYTNLNWEDIGSNIHRLKLKLDLYNFLTNSTQPINLKTDYTTHSGIGEEVISLKVIQNFKEALQPF